MSSVPSKIGRKAYAELEALCEANNGILRADDVVEQARDPNSSLHKRFTWDDTVAAQQYRLEQARQLIRYAVIYIQRDGIEVPVRGMINLPSDRYLPGGGYRPTIEVMTNDDMRKEHLLDLRKSVKRLQERFKVMTELVPAFEAFDAAISDAIAKEIERTNEIEAVA